MNNLSNDRTERTNSFTRRAFILGGLQVGILGILGGRLAWLQVAEGQKYTTLAEQNRINVKLLPPERGEITDRYGVPLATNIQDFRVFIIPEQTQGFEEALTKLATYVSINERAMEQAKKHVKRNAKFVPIEIRGGLERTELSTIEVNLPHLPGVMTAVGQKRTYPFEEATAHLVGYVGAISDKELETEPDNPVLSLPSLRIGKSGIEKSQEQILRGDVGQAEVEVNVHGREVRTLGEQKSVQGERITLTLDAELQRYVQNRLDKERSASAVIMDVHTGEVYALSSTPSFDPNYFVDGISHERWADIQSNPSYPLNNKALTGLYPPASTFKMIVALAFLEEGVATTSTRTNCKGFYQLGTGRFHCWKEHGHGSLNVIGAIEESCDIFFYELSTKLGIDKIADMARKFGLGQESGVNLGAEKAGIVPTKRWKLANFDERWQPGETVVASIGQGYLSSTPLQLCIMTARLVNGGYAVTPQITAAIGTNKIVTPEWPSLGINPENLKIVTKAMEQVMEGRRGTARASQITDEQFKMGGKTGTAQVQRITRAQRLARVKNEDLPWEQRHHALFVGYAPLDKPRYACSVVVEHGVGGSRAAAPIARDILWEAQRRAPHEKEVTV